MTDDYPVDTEIFEYLGLARDLVDTVLGHLRDPSSMGGAQAFFRNCLGHRQQANLAGPAAGLMSSLIDSRLQRSEAFGDFPAQGFQTALLIHVGDASRGELSTYSEPVTAPVFLATAETVEPAGILASAGPGDRLVLTGPEARHAVTVRRIGSGECVDISDGEGLRLLCTVASASGKERLELEVLERVEEAAPAVRLVLVQALAKGGRDEQAVETATEVGVERVIPWQAERSIAQWKGLKVEKGRQRWQATATEAAKQARRAWVPVVEEPLSTKALATWIEEQRQAGGVVALLHEEASEPMRSVALPEVGSVAVIVGPEGGIGEVETQQLVEAGAQLVRLGPHVMRTASAGPVALAILAERAGLWGGR